MAGCFETQHDGGKIPLEEYLNLSAFWPRCRLSKRIVDVVTRSIHVSRRLSVRVIRRCLCARR